MQSYSLLDFCIATYLDFFLESFLKIKDDGETGNGGLNGRGVLRPWTCSWSKGDSNGDSWKNDDEDPIATGEYAGALFGECSCVTKKRRKTRDCSQKDEDGEDVCEGDAIIDEDCEVPDELNVCRESTSWII